MKRTYIAEDDLSDNQSGYFRPKRKGDLESWSLFN